jgi:cytochrome b561
LRLVGWTMEGDDEALALLAMVAVHVGLVLSHTVVRRDGQLRRML